MTDKDALIQPDRGQDATEIHLISKTGFADWLKDLSLGQRAALKAQKFTAGGYEMAIVPDTGKSADGWFAVGGVANPDDLSSWCLAKLAERLPAGTYRLARGDPGPALHGWQTGQYIFDRYRPDEEREGDRILLTKQAAAIAPALAEARAVCLVRDLVNTPAEDMGPAALEAQAEELAKRYNAKLSVTTGELDDVVRQMTLDGGAVPATMGYRGYAHSCCTSLNNVICHGIPSDKIIKEGDILNIDVTPLLDGWHGDTSRMYVAGEASIKAKRLIENTYECLMLGIEMAKPGAYLGDIGAAIQKHAEGQRYGVVREFCGHGLGRLFHDAPEVVHAARAGTGPELKQGMFFTIEPMINLGKPGIKMLDDGWTAVTRDRSLSAQFEHSIGITETGCEIFTLSSKGLNKPPY